MEVHSVWGVFSVCCVNKQPPKALQESDKHHLICGAKTIRARYIDGAAPPQPSSPSVRQHPCREDTCSLCVSNHTPAVPRCLMASRSACRRKAPGTQRMRSRPASVPLGAVRGLGQMGYRHREQGRGGGFEGESEGEGMASVCVCAASAHPCIQHAIQRPPFANCPCFIRMPG